MTLNPVPLNPNRDFVFHVNYDGAQFDDVEALLIGLSFNHAPVKLPLERVKDNQYRSKTLFPICTEKKMKWRIHLISKRSGKKYKTNLDFEVSRD